MKQNKTLSENSWSREINTVLLPNYLTTDSMYIFENKQKLIMLNENRRMLFLPHMFLNQQETT